MSEWIRSHDGTLVGGVTAFVIWLAATLFGGSCAGPGPGAQEPQAPVPAWASAALPSTAAVMVQCPGGKYAGSAFAIAPRVLVTAGHVLLCGHDRTMTTDVWVALPDGKVVRAEGWAAHEDPAEDDSGAILLPEGVSLTPLPLAPSPAFGDLVCAASPYPKVKVKCGTVLALDLVIEEKPREGYFLYAPDRRDLEFAVAGNSGSPVLGPQGVVGILVRGPEDNTWAIAHGTDHWRWHFEDLDPKCEDPTL